MVDAETSEAVGVHRTPFGFERVDVQSVLLAAGVNKQLYRNGCELNVESEAVEEASQVDPLRLHNPKEPNLIVIHEKIEHRLAMYLKSRGKSNREIAEQCGWTQPWTSQVTRQPWFRMRVLSILDEEGRDQLSEIFKSEAINSAFTLVDIRDDAAAPKAVRKSACDSLLDRFIGKPTARVEVADHRLPSTEETRKIDAEIQSIDQQLHQPSNEETNNTHTPNPA